MTEPLGAEKGAPIQYEIVKPTITDIPQLLDLWKEQYEYHHAIDPTYYVPYSETLRGTVEGYLQKLIADQDEEHILVAREGPTLVGFVTFGTETESYFDTNITRYGEIKELLVKPDNRKQGIGKALIDRVEENFRSQNLSHVKIQVSSFNPTALAVYEKLGYTPRQQLLYKQL